MGNTKFKVNKGIPQLIVKSQKGQQICERELYAINGNEVSGLVPVTVLKKGAGFQLVYDLSGYIPLIEHLAVPMNKERFASALIDILENLQGLKDAVFNEAAVWLDPAYVYVEPQTQKLTFIYVPLTFFDCGTELRQMLQGMMQFCVFDPGEDLSFVSEFIELLNRGASFSTFELEQYVNGLKEQIMRSHRPKRCPNCGSIKHAAAFCTECGCALVELDGDDGEAAVSQPAKTGCPCLFRERTGERVFLDCPHFRIGKSVQNNEYSMPEIKTVSRSHATIEASDDRYFIMDMGSTNGTFVNDQEIPANTRTEIGHGDRIRLANETFIFEITQ